VRRRDQGQPCPALGVRPEPVIGSRRLLTEQLAARGQELEAERALFAMEAVRYERARIARELHDIVAHCVSVMVIQASAGQRLTATDPSLAAEAFESIGELVTRAGAAGLAVSRRFTGSADGLPDAAYRVVQESLTNAFKHAPGAPVDVVIAGASGHVEIGVVNGPTTGPQSGSCWTSGRCGVGRQVPISRLAACARSGSGELMRT
jgi:signal transduction histidine kinase